MCVNRIISSAGRTGRVILDVPNNRPVNRVVLLQFGDFFVGCHLEFDPLIWAMTASGLLSLLSSFISATEI